MGAAPTFPRKITLTMPLKDEFLSDIIINASETSYSWFAFDIAKRKWQKDGATMLNNKAFDTPKFIDGAVCIFAPLRYDQVDKDEGNLKGRFELTLDTVTEGIRRIVSGEVKCGMQLSIIEAVAAQDAGCIDANLGDLIVQAAIFNEIVYA